MGRLEATCPLTEAREHRLSVDQSPRPIHVRGLTQFFRKDSLLSNTAAEITPEGLRTPPPKMKKWGASCCAPKSTQSERFQEGQQAVVGTKPPEWRVHRLNLGQRLFLHGQIRAYTLVVCLDAFVPEPHSNDGNVDIGLQ